MSPEEILESNDAEAMKDWVNHHKAGTWFTSDLLHLAFHADSKNLVKLMQVYPEEIALVVWYRTGLNPRKMEQLKEQHESAQ